MNLGAVTLSASTWEGQATVTPRAVVCGSRVWQSVWVHLCLRLPEVVKDTAELGSEPAHPETHATACRPVFGDGRPEQAPCASPIAGRSRLQVGV